MRRLFLELMCKIIIRKTSDKFNSTGQCHIVKEIVSWRLLLVARVSISTSYDDHKRIHALLS